MRVAIVGFGAESSTFSMNRMDRSDFSVHRGDELLALYDLDAWIPRADEITWIPLVRAHAGAGGPIEQDVFLEIVEEITHDLSTSGTLDGIYIDLHGAAHVFGILGAEEYLLKAIREVVGAGPIISMSMDTHGNFSRQLAETVDLAVCFRHAPHIDAWEIRERALRLLVETLRDGRRPLKAWVRVPVLLPGERTSTLVEPARTVFGSLLPAIERYGVIDASLWVGFAWADEDRNGAAVMVTGYDADAIVACAREIAESYWRARHEFVIVADNSGPWSEALDFALAGQPAPLFISDAGDNVTAGSSGDITYAIAETLQREDVLSSGLTFLFAGLSDAEAVEAAIAAGAGSRLTLAIGASIDSRFAGPVERDWRVEQIVAGANEGDRPAGAVLSSGRIHVLVQRGRSYFMAPSVIQGITGRKLVDHAWIPSTGYDVVVVKNGYLFPGQTDEAGSWFMAITPGGTDLDVDRLEFTRVWRPIFPLDLDFEADLEPIVLPTP